MGRLLLGLLALGLAGCASTGADRVEPGPPMELRASVAGTALVVSDRPLLADD